MGILSNLMKVVSEGTTNVNLRLDAMATDIEIARITLEEELKAKEERRQYILSHKEEYKQQIREKLLEEFL